MEPHCVVLPPGLQSLLMATGLVRTLASCNPVLVATEREHVRTVTRLFHGADVRFWVDDPDPVAHAARLGMRVTVLPADPKAMYSAAGLAPRLMHAAFAVLRDPDKERELLERVVRDTGPSFVLTWSEGGSLHGAALPDGIPAVDAGALGVDDPVLLCGLMESALQVHAVDGWFLTLADLVGGSSRKFCHVQSDVLGAISCRRKYRKRVSVVCRPGAGKKNAT